MSIYSSENTSSTNPIIKKARWIVAKLKHAGAKGLLPEESVFVAELSRRAFILQDRTARQLVDELQKAHLEFQFTLKQRPQ